MHLISAVAGIAALGVALGAFFRVPMLLAASALLVGVLVCAAKLQGWSLAETIMWTALSLIELHACYLAGLLFFRASRGGSP